MGQGFYLSVPLPRGPYSDRQVLRAAFEKGYREKFTNTPPQVTVEFVNIRVTASALQVHGGIGFTWEHDLHFYLKRAKANAHAFGDARWHRDRVAQLAGV